MSQTSTRPAPAHGHTMSLDIVPCTACSWTPLRQARCSYHSNVKLVHGAHDRGAWTLGSRYVLKDRSYKQHCEAEVLNNRFVRAHTRIRVPDVLAEWKEDGATSLRKGRYFVIQERLDGVNLEEAWPALSADTRRSVARQVGDCLRQLRALTSERACLLDGGAVTSPFFFLELDRDVGNYRACETDDEVWDGLARALPPSLDPAVRERLREAMPACRPFTFSHGDLTGSNIIIRDGALVGIIDWEFSGYYPVWWEYVKNGIRFGKEDDEWKRLLEDFMPKDEKFVEERQFYRFYYQLCQAPEEDETKAMIKEFMER